MKTKFSLFAIAITVLAFAGGYELYGKSNHTINKAVIENSGPFVKTSYNNLVAPPDFENAASSAIKSVVHIKTLTKARQVASRKGEANPFGDMFGNDDLFKRFFGENGGTLPPSDQRASGSGVIINGDGYIVTNNHVVDGATDITVTMDNRKSYKAKVVGTDANTDLAILKIDAKNLSAMPIGNSDEVHLGQWVLAVGYPLDLDVTVTQGIVSAKSRNIGINRQGKAPVEAFIQTDAAVNPGSSGGALININGELIGINAAIASPTGAYAGYAYSIPSNLMKKVIGDIMKYGSVQRGYLGISMAPDELDDAKKKDLGIKEQVNGVYVLETDSNGAAAEAGIRKGDAIVKVNGFAVGTASELSEQIARQKPGDKISISFVRGSEEKTVNVILKAKMGSFASQKAAAIESLGANFNALSKEEAVRLGISGGVQVAELGDGVLSDQTTMKAGFVITKIGDAPVKTIDDLKEAISKQSGNFQIQGIYPGSSEVYYYGINDFGK